MFKKTHFLGFFCVQNIEKTFCFLLVFTIKNRSGRIRRENLKHSGFGFPCPLYLKVLEWKIKVVCKVRFESLCSLIYPSHFLRGTEMVYCIEPYFLFKLSDRGDFCINQSSIRRRRSWTSENLVQCAGCCKFWPR